MTPEERAAVIIARYENMWENWDDERAWVAAAFRAAIAEEREACARIAETWNYSGTTIMGCCHWDVDCGKDGHHDPFCPVAIAAAIRARRAGAS